MRAATATEAIGEAVAAVTIRPAAGLGTSLGLGVGKERALLSEGDSVLNGEGATNEDVAVTLVGVDM